MDTNDIKQLLRKHITRKQTFPEDATGVTSSTVSEASEEKLIVASTELAKTTEQSAVLLATTTEHSATVFRENTKHSERWMRWLTIAVVGIGLLQVDIALISLFLTARLRL